MESRLRPKYVSLNEAAAFLAVSRDTARRMIRRGDLAAVRIGRSIRVEINSLESAGKPLSAQKRRQ